MPSAKLGSVFPDLSAFPRPSFGLRHPLTDLPSSEAHRSLAAPVSGGVPGHLYCRWHTRLSPVELDIPSGERDPARFFTPVRCRLWLARLTEEAAGPSWLSCSLVLEPHCGPFPHPFLSLTLPSLSSSRRTAWTLKSPELGPCCRKFFGETVLFCSHIALLVDFFTIDYFTNIYLFICVAALSLGCSMWDL